MRRIEFEELAKGDFSKRRDSKVGDEGSEKSRRRAGRICPGSFWRCGRVDGRRRKERIWEQSEICEIFELKDLSW